MDLDRVSDRVVDCAETVTNGDVLEYAYDNKYSKYILDLSKIKHCK